MGKLRSDVVHAWRSLRARPAATGATVLVLGVGVGLTAAMFALADPFLLRPLPYPRPAELVVIELSAGSGATLARVPTLSDWQARDDLFQGVAAYRAGDVMRLRTAGGGAALQTMEVSENLLPLLGVPAPKVVASREHQGRESADLPVVLTATAHERLSGGGSIAEQSFPRQGGGTIRVTGVLPRAFLFPRAAAGARLDSLIFVTNPALLHIERSPGGQSFSANPFTLVARLRAGVTPNTVEEALGGIGGDTAGLKVAVRPLTSYMRRGIEPLALGTFSAGVLVLLICAANVGNLLLARGVYRSREFATREAIGATRGDLARLILVELALITAGGITSGLFLAHVALGAVEAVIPDEYSALGMPAVTIRVLAYAGVVGAVVMIASTIPAWAAWRVAPRALVERIGFSEGRTVRALRFGMAAAQSAFAVVLCSGAALLVRSYVNLILQDTGFGHGVHVVSVSYPSELKGPLLQADIDATLERLRRLHGVVAAGAATGPMVDSLRTTQIVHVGGVGGLVERKSVSAGYFEAVGTRIVAGRGLAATDRNAAAVVNESFARRYWTDGGAVGKQVTLGPFPGEIVGIARDTFDVAWDTPPGPTVFALLHNPAFGFRVSYALRFAPRSRPADVLLAREVAAVNADAVIIETSSLSGRLAGTVRDRSFATLVLTFFAIAGVGVCAAGLIGVVSFVAARRTREIAIRIAVGATPSGIRRLIVQEAAAATGAGALTGLVIGRWLSKTLEAHTYGVEAGDWSTTVTVALLMIAVVAAAAVIPATRAMRLSPSAALREE